MDQWVVDPVISFLKGVGWESEGWRGVEMPDLLFQEPRGKLEVGKGGKSTKLRRR
jgi:hypothetical protein